MNLKNFILKKKIENILKSKTAVNLIIKHQPECPPEMALADIKSFMKRRTNNFVIGINRNKKTGEIYYKVLSDVPVDFELWPYKISGSHTGKKMTAEDYLPYFTADNQKA